MAVYKFASFELFRQMEREALIQDQREAWFICLINAEYLSHPSLLFVHRCV